LGCDEDDAIVVVWGPELDTRTAVEEIRLRLVEALDGVPNETRQPFPDGSTDFERILPGPDRMYPDTDSPPTQITRDRVARLRAALPELPWQREERYARVGVPASTIHYLIRRGGAALVDRVVAECGADLRFACFFFGERLVGQRRAGVAVGAIGAERWCDLFRAFAERPVLREAWERLVRRMTGSPGTSVSEQIAAEGLGEAPAGWRETLGEVVEAARRDAYDARDGRPARLAVGRAMGAWRGRVPAREVIAALAPALETQA
jgi:glutamyl-tRNA(Gln) amidotransferase subunit E